MEERGRDGVRVELEVGYGEGGVQRVDDVRFAGLPQLATVLFFRELIRFLDEGVALLRQETVGLLQQLLQALVLVCAGDDHDSYSLAQASTVVDKGLASGNAAAVRSLDGSTAFAMLASP